MAYKNKEDQKEYHKKHREVYVLKKPFQPFVDRCNSQVKKYNLNKVKYKQLEDIYNKQGGICPILNKYFPPNEMSVDHIIPLSRGGTNDSSNLRFIYWRLNFAKLDSTEEEFIKDWKMIEEAIVNNYKTLMSIRI